MSTAGKYNPIRLSDICTTEPLLCRMGFHRWTGRFLIETGRIRSKKIGRIPAEKDETPKDPAWDRGSIYETHKRVCVECHQPEYTDFMP